MLWVNFYIEMIISKPINSRQVCIHLNGREIIATLGRFCLINRYGERKRKKKINEMKWYLMSFEFLNHLTLKIDLKTNLTKYTSQKIISAIRIFSFPCKYMYCTFNM